MILADDEAKVRSALKLLLEQQPDIHVVGEAGNAEALSGCLGPVCAGELPDLLILDWELPGLNLESGLTPFRASNPNLKVVALSCLPGARKASIYAGADAFVSKNDPPDRILSVLEEIAGWN